MTKSQLTPSEELLKDLKRKAELCRYGHSSLHEKYRKRQRIKGFAIVALSVLTTTLTGVYYRGLVKEEWMVELVLFGIFFLPLVVVLLQSLDHIVFCWTDQANRHESAVQIWGAWIRDANFLEKKFSEYSKDIANEKLENTQAKYNDCMFQTPQIPNNKFLKYKREHNERKLRAKALDSMTLDDFANEKWWRWKKAKK